MHILSRSRLAVAALLLLVTPPTAPCQILGVGQGTSTSRGSRVGGRTLPDPVQAAILQLQARYGYRVVGDPGAITLENLKILDEESRPIYARDPDLKDWVKTVRLVDSDGEDGMGVYEDDRKELVLFTMTRGGSIVRGTPIHEFGHPTTYKDEAWHRAVRRSLVWIREVFPSDYAMENAYEHTAELLRWAAGVDGIGNDFPGTRLPRATWDLLAKKVTLRADWKQRILPEAIVLRGPPMPALSDEPLFLPGMDPGRGSPHP